MSIFKNVPESHHPIIQQTQMTIRNDYPPHYIKLETKTCQEQSKSQYNSDNDSCINNTQIAQRYRVGSVDMLKGFAILFVLWSHTCCIILDSWDPGTFGNITFFILSGFFFKITDIKSFFKKKTHTIIIPFLFFYLLTYPFAIIVDYWDTRDYNSINFGMVWDVFMIRPECNYIHYNFPLWFLLAIFIIQSFALIIFRLPKWTILCIALIALTFKEELFTIPTPFMINNACYWFGYFTLGFLFGKPILNVLRTLDGKLKISVISSLIFAICILHNYANILDWRDSIEKIQYISISMFCLSIFSLTDCINGLNFLKFIGSNTLIILGAHIWFMLPLNRIANKILPTVDPIIGVILTVLTIITMVPFIGFMNKKFPHFVGK